MCFLKFYLMKEYEEFKNYLYFVLGRSKSTVDSYIRDLKDIEKILGDERKGIEALDEEDLERIVNRLRTIYDVTSINRKLSALRTYLRFLARQSGKLELMKKIKRIRNIKDSRKIPDVPGEDTVISKIEGITPSGFESIRDRLILELLYGSGLRVSELVNLKLNDIMTEKDVIKIEGKGKKERFVPINSETKRTLSLYIEERKKLKPKTDHVILNLRGRKITRQGVWFILKKYGFHPHILRHSFATHLLQRGMNIRDVQIMLGHSNLSTTEIYTKVAPKLLRETVIRFHPLSRTTSRMRKEPSST